MPIALTDPIVKKTNGQFLRLAVLDDQRHRLHADSAPNALSASPYFKFWVADYVENTIKSPSTREQLLRDMPFPLASNELVDDISDSASSVHHAQDRFISIELNDEALQVDAEAFIESLDVNGFMARDCHNALFDAPNSMIVVDLPTDQGADRFPSPYMYLLGTDKIEKAVALKNGLLQFIVFATDDPNRKALYDNEAFTIYEKGVNGWSQVINEAHGLDHCPVFKMWSDVRKFSPLCSNTLISPSLALLDQYIYWTAAGTSNDQKGAFAPFWHLQEAPRSCDYKNEYGYTCEDGVVLWPGTNAQGNPATDMLPTKQPCPKCAQKPLPGGLGSRLPVPVPKTKDDVDMRPPAGWINPSIESLKYLQEKVVAMADTIRRSATGREGSPKNKQALNATQIAAILEASRTIGQYLAEYFEVAHKRTLDTLLRLRYGPAYIGCTVNYGRRFSTLSADILVDLLANAKQIGAVWLVEEISLMLRDYYSRGDASRARRYQMLDDLSKYPYYSALDLYDAGINALDPAGFLTHVGLIGYVKRFEREIKCPIERFGVLSPYSTVLETISKRIASYVAEIKPVETSGNGNDGQQNNGSSTNKRRNNGQNGSNGNNRRSGSGNQDPNADA